MMEKKEVKFSFRITKKNRDWMKKNKISGIHFRKYLEEMKKKKKWL